MTTKILIVDDEPINVKLIEEILEYEDEFQCETAMDGESALAILDVYNPDIIVLDIMMPGLNGYEICKQIKKNERHKFAKVLMVSGKAMVEERLEGYEAGADDYITKPFVDDELLAKLKVFSKLKKAEEIDELKTGILQLFSHETKTPLNGILLGSQLILDTPSLPDKITEYAKLIKISGERIHDLVRKILLLSSLKSPQRLTLGIQPLGTYLAGLTSKNEYLPSYNIKFDLICPENFNLNVDWKLFHEAVVAVIDNGIKFTPAGGTLSIKAQCDSNFVFLHVQDQGPGVDPTLKEKIFDEFYSQQIENHSKGTALSLAISKKIMQLHGGDLCVEGAAEEGATFTFTLPISTLVSS